ncbi:MAG: aminotransferase class V-fold PLP-dependent enzyme [Chloroflexota bacterium]|nr:aminotransferase class V-fold PLP-dependent enzyme [Chloroflexota bacterium]
MIADVRTATDIRDQFLLDPTVVFLNHGSFGACPKPVFAEYQRWQAELERQPVEFLGRRGEALLDEAREHLGAYLNVGADDLVFIQNATAGINVIARSLPLEQDDEVLTTDLEYGALDQTWQHICSKTGSRYLRQPVPLPVGDPSAVVDAIWSGVTPRTKVLFISHITSGTALTLPVAALCRRAREADILSVIDGAHVPGHLPLDLDALGADVYAGNCHKWLCAPKGSAFLYVRPEQQTWVESLIVSWGWVPESGHHRPTQNFVSRNQWQGTRDLAAFLAVPAAIAFQKEHDWDSVRAECHKRTVDTWRRITELTGLPPLSADPPDGGWAWFSQMAANPLPAVNAEAFKRRLYDDYRIEIPIHRWGDGSLIRVSVQGYNSTSDLDHLVAAVEQLLADRSLRL